MGTPPAKQSKAKRGKNKTKRRQLKSGRCPVPGCTLYQQLTPPPPILRPPHRRQPLHTFQSPPPPRCPACLSWTGQPAHSQPASQPARDVRRQSVNGMLFSEAGSAPEAGHSTGTSCRPASRSLMLQAGGQPPSPALPAPPPSCPVPSEPAGCHPAAAPCAPAGRRRGIGRISGQVAGLWLPAHCCTCCPVRGSASRQVDRCWMWSGRCNAMPPLFCSPAPWQGQTAASTGSA